MPNNNLLPRYGQPELRKGRPLHSQFVHGADQTADVVADHLAQHLVDLSLKELAYPVVASPERHEEHDPHVVGSLDLASKGDALVCANLTGWKSSAVAVSKGTNWRLSLPSL